MKNSMVIRFDNGANMFIMCAALCCDSAKPRDEIEHYYSYGHAISCGWVATKEERYCQPGQSVAWVCPDCYDRGGGVMALYDYLCSNCQNRFMIRKSIEDETPPSIYICPQCGGTGELVFSPAYVIYKCKGFYSTGG